MGKTPTKKPQGKKPAKAYLDRGKSASKSARETPPRSIQYPTVEDNRFSVEDNRFGITPGIMADPVQRKRELVDIPGRLQNTTSHRMSPFEKIELVEQGISKKALENLKQEAGLDYDQLSKVLNVARTTLLSKKGEEKFNSDMSDKILGLADIYSYGYAVFEDRERFNEWIFRANKALGGQAPFDILHNSFGREEVKHLIGRIDHGVYS